MFKNISTWLWHVQKCQELAWTLQMYVYKRHWSTPYLISRTLRAPSGARLFFLKCQTAKFYISFFSSCEALKQCAVNSAVGPAEQVGRLYAFCPDSTIFFTIQSHAIPLDSSNCEWNGLLQAIKIYMMIVLVQLSHLTRLLSIQPKLRT